MVGPHTVTGERVAGSNRNCLIGPIAAILIGVNDWSDQKIDRASLSYEQLVAQRRSIRGYKKQPVPRELLEEVISVAKRAPSSMNTQPWHFHVITGDPLERIREGNTERMLAGAAVDREIKMGHGYEGIHRDRQVEIAIQLFEAMGIERNDKERRQDWVMRGFRQFDAPVSDRGDPRQGPRTRHGQPLRLGRSDLRPGPCCMVSGAWVGHQRSGHHAILGCARTRATSPRTR